MNAKRTVVPTVVGLFVALGFVLAGAKAQSSAAPHSPGPGQVTTAGPKKAEEQFKNIQVLKGISADQLIPTMQFITASLGVECDFCHVQGAFEKDDKKPKQTARKMMEMMFAINADNFDRKREVTCYSCHRGSTDPAATPVVMEEAKAGADVAKQNEFETKIVGGPSGDELIDKYLRAVGGAAAIDKIKSRVMKGTVTFGDRDVPIEIFAKDPEKRISITH